MAEGVVVEISIKCPRCKTINNVKAESLPDARHERRSFSGGVHAGKTIVPLDRG
ncbi:MAG: Com family DNA-binding transcriptional regulator [Rhodocyclaceae bacterium]|nr:Com family DNA-binding transcriptional regulator [Rhodocyclaceae bacterium]